MSAVNPDSGHPEAESLPHLFTRLPRGRTGRGRVRPGQRRLRDASLPLMVGFSMNDVRFRIVDLSRNFGHQLAVSAGLSVVRGGVVAILDADLRGPARGSVPYCSVGPRASISWDSGAA